MANYYVSNTGDNTNDGLTPSNPWLDLGYALQNTNASSNVNFSDSIFIMSNVNLSWNWFSNVFTNRWVKIYSYLNIKHEITVDSSSATAQRILGLYGTVQNLKFNYQAYGSHNSTYVTFYASIKNCDFTENPLISDKNTFMFTSESRISDSKLENMTIVQALTNVVGGWHNCIFSNLMLGDVPANNTNRIINFTNCVFNNVVSLNQPSYMFYRATSNTSMYFDNCSILLNFNQSLTNIISEDITNVHIKNSVIENLSGSGVIYDIDNDFNNTISIENCVLYNTTTHNPVYSIQALNVITTLESNFKSVDPLSPDFFQLTEDSPARLYSTEQNIDAGALQAPPLVLFPEINEVTENIPFGLGKLGDRTGTNRLAPENKVEIDFEYGDPLIPSIGTLPVASIVDPNIIITGNTVNGVPGEYVPANPFFYKEGETFGEENGTSRVGEAELKQAQHGRIPVVIKTSDGSNISATYPVPSQQFNVLKNYDIDLQLADTDIPERVGNGTITVIDNEDDELIYTMILER